VNHRPRALYGQSLAEAMATDTHQPARLVEDYQRWRHDARSLLRAPPLRAFAAIGQARVDGAITPEAESKVLSGLLKHWALRRALEGAPRCEPQTTRLPARAA